MSILKDFSVSTVAAGFVTVLVGFTSSAVIIFQAAQALGASPAEIASWIWALGIGIGLTSIGLSLYYKMPIVTAWSTPGAALLISSASGLSMAEAIGGFLISAGLIILTGFSGLFERTMRKIPISIASAMLAGILIKFGMNVFIAMTSQFVMVFGMFLVYLFARRFQPRYAVVLTLLVGVIYAGFANLLTFNVVQFQVASPIWIMPVFSVHSLAIGLPLFIVTMTSQNIPGVSVLRASGYHAPISPIVGWIGIVNAVLAPLGAFALNLAAITAAICTGREAHEDSHKRYTAALSAGILYCLIGIFGATITSLFLAFPRELILAIAGLALFGTVASGLATALDQEAEREAALITFLVTASGVTLWGIGAAFWGLLAGIIALVISRYRKVIQIA
ncbi:benzoate/H(+) symporter BenE family transporter [Aquirhabdus sp.]|uniref:benzoate/H(+) symporter BenE family transporter n=1 Tax=Aquirhabdus sp. TaxID=2824160 RepID=UPI00396C3305